jgi:AcrR family transcriptional regulator
VEKFPTGARNNRRQVKKASIINHAACLFAEKGYHRTTTREIAQEAGVAEGTLYNYFINKEDILFQIVACLADSFGLPEMLEEGTPDEPYKAILTLLGERIEWIRKNRTMLQVIYSEIMVNPSLREKYQRQVYFPSVRLLEEHLEARISSGQIRSLNIPLTARFLAGLSIGMFMLNTLRDETLEGSWSEMIALMGDIIHTGMIPNE